MPQPDCLDSAAPRVCSPAVAVIGAGHVGLPLALMLACSGLSVAAVDINESVVGAINSGALPAAEEDVRDALASSGARRHLRAVTSPEAADVFVVAVPTPLDPELKTADLRFVTAAVRGIVPLLRPGNLVIIESTVPPLTCRKVITPILEEGGLKVGEEIHLAYCPERILPGSALRELVHNDRVIGSPDARARELAAQLYGTFHRGEMHFTDDVTAEVCKLMENTFRDVNIALANEFAVICETAGVDVNTAVSLANRHPRVEIHSPGIGVGGHCIPVAPWFLDSLRPGGSGLLAEARRVNDSQPALAARKIAAMAEGIGNPVIVAIGAGYKPDSADRRGSPADRVVALLRAEGHCVHHYDPLVPGMSYGSIADVAAGADLLVVLVPHTEVQSELGGKLEAIKSAMRRPVVHVF